MDGEARIERVDVAVIGAGQAGLAIGYHLARQGRDFVILDRADDVGSAWRERWDSLTLFTPRRYDGLPGMEFPGEPDGYPARDEVVAYLRSYAAAFDLPVRLGADARSLVRAGDRFAVELADGRIEADQVVVATGAFQAPRVPSIAAGVADDVVQMHSTAYRRPSDLPAGPTLVVGGGNTGFQIAEELAADRETHLAVGTRQMPLPQRLLGRDTFWWLTKTGLIEKTVESRIGQRARSRETLVGMSPRRAKRRGIRMHGRATSATGRAIGFEDGSRLEVTGVVWATGFRSDHSWIELPITDADGAVVHRRGVTDVAGLYLLGQQWQYTRGSALIGWVGSDAAFIADQVAERAPALQQLQDKESIDEQARTH